MIRRRTSGPWVWLCLTFSQVATIPSHLTIEILFFSQFSSAGSTGSIRTWNWALSALTSWLTASSSIRACAWQPLSYFITLFWGRRAALHHWIRACKIIIKASNSKNYKIILRFKLNRIVIIKLKSNLKRQRKIKMQAPKSIKRIPLRATLNLGNWSWRDTMGTL